MQSNEKNKFNIDTKVIGTKCKGTEFPQSSDRSSPTGVLSTNLSFEGIVVRNDQKIVLRITEVSDHGNKQIEEVQEKGMQQIVVGQILAMDELPGWDIRSI